MKDLDISEYGAGDLLRVERGRADAEEVAALTVLLLGLRARGRQRDGERLEPEWPRWPEPRAAYRAPGSWR
ncbi:MULTISPECIES: acyl-CoA carboxylase subunit epsilon [unclassified Streptomyces]|uniref:acyl-CoA carboxylase subunit epsilon n=1 Tax=unclassified Streptomyces TaxID=2593676 RepID=UPI00036A6F1C|nr:MULTISPECIES: acyl-CoA carboxylase subunit epsilon [unclassified Streptomyces]MYY01888.1 acyl-CoA carboxylase subunit epsilon [Streptomyces sp. SID4913]